MNTIKRITELLAVCFVIVQFPLISASAQITFERTYGGIGEDQSYSAIQTLDGGYIVTGYTYSYGAGSADVYLIKTDSLGDILWTKTYGNLYRDFGHSIAQTSDGGYIIAGGTMSYGAGSYDVYLIKTDSLGDTLWVRTYGGADGDCGYSVAQTSDGGYIVSGYTYSYGAGSCDVYLMKTDPLGDTLWTRTYGGADEDCGISVAQTSDGGYIVSGYTYSYGAGSGDVYLVKTDSLGDTLWTKTHGGNYPDYGLSVIRTPDEGYIITGFTYSYWCRFW